jgi:diacylglycerol kinase family enzyme
MAPDRGQEPAAAQPIAPGATKKRMLIIVNPYATTVSDRLKNLVVYALQARYDVEAVDTEASEHAIEIGREAQHGEYDIVVAFGGDGTLNEVANGLAGTDVPVSVLPGGSTNVVCRTLGIPNDVVDATEHLIAIADDFRPRKIDLGRINGRHFVFACGMGLDATVVKRVDAHPRMKARAGQWYFTWAAVSGFYREYMRNPVRMSVELEGNRFEGVTAILQNSDPFTYFGNRPVRVCDGAALDNGTLSLAVLRRAAQRDMGSIAGRVLGEGERSRPTAHRQIDHAEAVTEALFQSISEDESGTPRRFPVQVDGDYIGDFAELNASVEPRALTVVA